MSAAHEPAGPRPAMPAATIPGPRPVRHRASVASIPGACDAHLHVFEAPWGPEYVPDPAYRAPEAPLDAYRALAGELGLQRAVIVQPSVYGSDHSVMLRALARDPATLRGVAVIGPDVPADALARLHAAGVRGVRVNLVSPNRVVGLDALAALEARIAPLGWHLQLFVDLAARPELVDAIAARSVPCVVDHFGHLQLDAPGHEAGLDALLACAALPNAWFKLSGSYRVTAAPFPFDALGAVARRIFERAPDRCVWGSDWPHPMCERMPDDGELLDALLRWFPGADERAAVLARNPARLYGFGPAG